MEKMWEAWLNDSNEVCHVINMCVGRVAGGGRVRRIKSGKIAS